MFLIKTTVQFALAIIHYISEVIIRKGKREDFRKRRYLHIALEVCHDDLRDLEFADGLAAHAAR